EGPGEQWPRINVNLLRLTTAHQRNQRYKENWTKYSFHNHIIYRLIIRVLRQHAVGPVDLGLRNRHQFMLAGDKVCLSCSVKNFFSDAPAHQIKKTFMLHCELNSPLMADQVAQSCRISFGDFG